MTSTPTAGLRDRVRAHLAATLLAEDSAEEQLGLSPHERRTCPVHRRWLYQCVSSPEHAIRVTGHRWCRRCDRPLAVAVDELTGMVTLACSAPVRGQRREPPDPPVLPGEHPGRPAGPDITPARPHRTASRVSRRAARVGGQRVR